MLRRHENKDSYKAGALAIAVHVALLGAMLVSFNWKAAHLVMNVTEVELWDKLPSAKSAPILQPKPLPKPEPVVEKPEPKVEPKPEPKPEPKIAESKIDIALEQKKKELEQKKLEEQAKKDKALQEKKLEEKKKLAALKAESRDEELKDEKLADNKLAEKKLSEKKQKDALKKLQTDALNEENAEGDKQAKAASVAANAGIIGEYKAKITAKIKGNVNKTLCGDGNPELRFEVGLLPTGELSGAPKLTKSSGNAACDDAVERAIAASQPLPLPSEPGLFSNFRNLNLKFKPNE